MKLTSKGRFAVTSLVDMAINSTGNKPISLSEISERQNISLAFLEQIFSLLKKREIVKSGEPILPTKRARKIPEKIQVSKEDLAELKNETNEQVEIKADTDEESDDVSIEELKEEENTNLEKSEDDSVNNQ